MTTDEILTLLSGVKKSRTGWTALCPAHHDRRPSLSIAQGWEGRVLIKCFAGCATDDVLDSLGLRMADLFPEDGNR
jgi:putative DNA primase/helicase